MKNLATLLLFLPLLAACDALQERMGIPIAAKVEAEGKAIGSACRHAGRGLEDCYRLNPQADKAAVHTGWKEMNEYMIKNNMQSIPPEFPAGLPDKASAKHAADAESTAAHGDAPDKAKGKAEDAHDAKGASATAKEPDAKVKDKSADEAKTEPRSGAEDKKKSGEKGGHGAKPAH